MKEKLFGTKDLGPTSTPCLFFWKLYRTKLNTKQITMQLKQVIQKILKHVMNNMLRIMNINKHKLSNNITKHCKKWGTALHSHHSPDLGGLIVMGGPQNLDGLFHGTAFFKVDGTMGYPQKSGTPRISRHRIPLREPCLKDAWRTALTLKFFCGIMLSFF